jgi:hypothetical protein
MLPAQERYSRKNAGNYVDHRYTVDQVGGKVADFPVSTSQDIQPANQNSEA